MVRHIKLTISYCSSTMVALTKVLFILLQNTDVVDFHSRLHQIQVNIIITIAKELVLQLTFPTNKEKDFMIDDCNKSNFIWSLMRKNSIPQSIPSWTCFQIVVNNNIPILKTTVGCLDCINAPATERRFKQF